MKNGNYKVRLCALETDFAGAVTIDEGRIRGESSPFSLEGRIAGIDTLCVASISVSSLAAQHPPSKGAKISLGGICDDASFAVSGVGLSGVAIELKGRWVAPLET